MLEKKFERTFSWLVRKARLKNESVMGRRFVTNTAYVGVKEDDAGWAATYSLGIAVERGLSNMEMTIKPLLEHLHAMPHYDGRQHGCGEE